MLLWGAVWGCLPQPIHAASRDPQSLSPPRNTQLNLLLRQQARVEQGAREQGAPRHDPTAAREGGPGLHLCLLCCVRCMWAISMLRRRQPNHPPPAQPPAAPAAPQNVSGLVRPGQLACLMGASGAGKTVREGVA